MTDGNPRPENESSDETRRDLAAPFIPGAPRPSPEPESEATPSPALPEPEPEATETQAPAEAPAEPTEPASEPFEPVEPEPAGAETTEAFPFETAWGEEETAGEEGVGEEGAAEPAGEPTPSGVGYEDEDDFPFEAFDIEGGAEAETLAAEPEPEEGLPPAWGEEPGKEGTGESPEDAEAREMAAARDLADRLEEMARRLRDQGGAAAREELESEDRFTALLAGLLAGYLAGRA